jgi:hypothetical protein
MTSATLARRAGKALGEAEQELTRRVAAEYREMPGLSLTLTQAERLWSADRQACERAFRTLIARGSLRMTRNGRFVRS